MKSFYEWEAHFERDGCEVLVGVAYPPKFVRPKLYVERGNVRTWYASFRNDRDAHEFMDALAELICAEKKEDEG